MTDLPADKFKCAYCGGVFDKEWTDAEAKAELETNFGDWPVEECAVVCDDCYEKFFASELIN